MSKKIKELISQMTLEEKASLCSGYDFWHTQPVERLGIPSVMVTDGPHGLRKQEGDSDHLGINESVPATCFPSAAGLATSWDRELISGVGKALGEECQAENVSVILGPGTNIKRSPLCGRNFEYFSEDPYLAGELAAAHIKGVQSQGAGTSLKHFAANNQETNRMGGNSVVDERTMREIYLTPFEIAVKKAQPWTVMSSYNQINGVFASDNHWLLTEVLRDEWGFEGYVVSDWGGTNDRIPALSAGMDLQMPADNGIGDGEILAAVKSGKLDEAVLDKAVERMLTILYKWLDNRKENATYDRDAHHATARNVAAQSMVLLKNDNGILPIDKSKKTLLIGELAKKIKYQGGGSSHINPTKLENVVDEMSAVVSGVTYEQGYHLDDDDMDEAMRISAVNAAKAAENVIIIAGLPDRFESEGFDRRTMGMPENQNKLIEAVLEVCPNAVVVLVNGSPVEIPWADRAGAILTAYMGGQAAAGAIVDIVTGKVNPSGRLAETWPVTLNHNPSALSFGNEGDVIYSEGVFVGYRYYESKEIAPRFPFGFGLSYTTFELSNLRLSKLDITETDELTVTVDVKNTGSVAGKETVQIYVGDPESSVRRPKKELKGFCKVALEPGETKTVEIELDRRAFAYWEVSVHDWFVESGEFVIYAGSSSACTPLTASVNVTGLRRKRPVFTLNSTFGELMKYPECGPILQMITEGMGQAIGGGQAMDTKDIGDTLGMDIGEMVKGVPLKTIKSFGAMSTEQLDGLVAQLNAIAQQI